MMTLKGLDRPITSKLQEATIMYIVGELNLPDLDAAKETFAMIDADGNGKITKDEMINHKEFNFTKEFVDQIFIQRDINNDGAITLNEWIVSFVDENNLLS